MKKFFFFIIVLLGIAAQAQEIPENKVLSDAQHYRAMGVGKSYEDAKVYAAYGLVEREMGSFSFESDEKLGTKVMIYFEPYLDKEGEVLYLRLLGEISVNTQKAVGELTERYQKLLVDTDFAKDMLSMIEPVDFVKLNSADETDDGLKVTGLSEQILSENVLTENKAYEFLGCLKWEALKFSSDSTCVVDGNEYHAATAEVSKITVQKLLVSIIRRVNQKQYICDEKWFLNEVRNQISN
ncbi:MAG: hypothetical protein IKT08_04110 [Bacteroidales bacterium]|nr:hypothetical protein [Bacteroidales bacterium]